MAKSQPRPTAQMGIEFPSPLASGNNHHLKQTLDTLTQQHYGLDRRVTALEGGAGEQSKPVTPTSSTTMATAALGTSMGPTQVPASATAPGVPGQVTWDTAGYHYMCIGQNKWVRSAAPYTSF